MHTFSLLVLPRTRDIAGKPVFQLAGPDLSTSSWGIYRRKLEGPLECMDEATTERDAQGKAEVLAERTGARLEPYPWAPTELLTACAVAVRTEYGYDLYDAGVRSEGDLYRLGITEVAQASDFAAAFGQEHGLQRIDR